MSKRNLLARGLTACGVPRLLETLPFRRCLTVLTYHRVGDPNATPYDQGVFSATANTFDAQIQYLKRRFHVIGLEEALSILDRPQSCASGAVMITFDDGYRDNYEIAFPLLRSHGVPATFFLPTSFIEADRLPWWDSIAFMVRTSGRSLITLDYPRRVEISTADPNATRLVLNLFKSPENRAPERFIAGLETASGVSTPVTVDGLFMNWAQAREMVQAGMTVGSHTHSHTILSKLSADQQRDELVTSRKILESQLGTRIESLAYPVGRPEAISADTPQVAQEAGYRIAFSHYGGINVPEDLNRYNILRVSIDLLWIEERFRVNLSSAAVACNSFIL